MLHGRPALRVLILAGLAAWGLAAGAGSGRAATPLVISVPGPDAATIAEALAAARSHRRAGERAIVIEIAGTHRLDAPVRLDASDSGTADAPLVIRAAPGSDASVLGSRPLRQVSGPLPADIEARLPATARGKVRRYALPPTVAGARRIDRIIAHEVTPTPPVPFEVFDAAGALRPARWPDDGWATTAESLETPATFRVSSERIRRWKGEEDLWAAGYWHWNWSYETRPVAEVDLAGMMVTLAEPTHYGIRPGARFFVYHALSELDRPGEWVRLPDHDSILLWPQDDTASAPGIEISMAESLFVLDGARHVRIEDLHLGRTRGDAIRVENGTDITVAGCVIRWTGNRGISFAGSRRSGVENSVVSDTGTGAVGLSGGDRDTLEPSGLFLVNSRIVRFGRLARTYHPGVRLSGVGIRVTGNLIADAPHAAILFSGNDHRIALNEIAGVVSETSDAGAVYTGRDWTARGTVIRHNFFHDIEPAEGFETKGIYLDDMASGTTIEENLFLRVNRPVFLGGGRDNLVRDNLFVAAGPAISLDARGLTWARPNFAAAADTMVRRLRAVPYRSATWRHRYPDLAAMAADNAGAPVSNSSRGNVVIGGALYDFEPPAQDFADAIGPDTAFATDRPGIAEAFSTARSAGDLARLFETSGTAAAMPALPFTQMDRTRFVPVAPGGGGRP